MGINFKGAVFSTEKFLPLINNGGSIINLSSINAYTGMPNTAIYAASKAALNAYTRTAATELAPRKIRFGIAWSVIFLINLGVLARCRIAMGALLLATLDPMEASMRSLSRQLKVAKVYVDDFAFMTSRADDPAIARGPMEWSVSHA